jgi:transposase
MSLLTSKAAEHQHIQFIHGSLKLKLCDELGANRFIAAPDTFCDLHSYNKALAKQAGKMLYSSQELKMIEKYKRTHDVFDALLQAEQFLRIVFPIGSTSSVPQLGIPLFIPGKRSKKPSKKKKTKKRTTNVSVKYPLTANVPKRVAPPKAQRELMKTKKAKTEAKLAIGTLVP